MPATRNLAPPRRARRVATTALVACAALATALVSPAVSGASASQSPRPTASDHAVLIGWNAIALAEAVTIRPTAHGQARGIAMVQGAVYDAVNAIDRGHRPYLLDAADLGIGGDLSYGAAIATAAHHVLVTLVANERRPALDAALASTLAAIPDGANKTDGSAAGTAAAAAMVAARTGDGYMAPFDFAPHIGTGPGQWDPTALDPDAYVGTLKPFLMTSPSQFRTDGPAPLNSTDYAEQYNEVKRLGALTSTYRTTDQTMAAIFWQFSPAVLWNTLARDQAAAHGTGTVELARLLAMVNLASADGAIACWNDKYHYNFWRPVTAIRKGDIDGNPATVADPTWTPLFDPSTPTVPAIGNPPFPDHPSGHGCLSGAALSTMATFFGDKAHISISSGRFPGQPRTFHRFSDVLKEIIDARVWGGIHFREADVEGSVVGSKVARWMGKHYFQPIG